MDERRLLERFIKELRKTRKLSNGHISMLRSTFGERFDRALKALEEMRVKKYIFEPSGRTLWIVVGKEREYEVLPDAWFCSCNDFYYRVLSGEVKLCYHLISQKLAEALGKYETVRENDRFYRRLMEEWRGETT